MPAFTAEELAYLQAHKDETRVTDIYWVYSIPIAFGILSTTLRLWAKSAGRNGITLDDWFIVVATICLVGECASGLAYGPPYGMGRHVTTVSPHDQSMVRKGDYVFSHFYDFALVFVKLGILAFYYRVFVVPLFRKIIIATTAFVVAWGIGITVTLILACRPIEAFWDASIKGDCLNLVRFTYFTNITNMATDVWIFLMPVPVIWHLQLQTRKKLLLCFIFSIGIATCIVSALRLTVVLGHGYVDFTWSYVPLGAYSAFEPLGCILCTNLPIIWHMWRKQKKSGALLPGTSLFRSKPLSAITPSPRESRRSRFARSLGLSTAGQTWNDSQCRTILDEEEGNSGFEEVNLTSPERALCFEKVERINMQAQEMAEADNRQDPGSKRTMTASESGSSHGPRAPNLKKTVWEVRRTR